VRWAVDGRNGGPIRPADPSDQCSDPLDELFLPCDGGVVARRLPRQAMAILGDEPKLPQRFKKVGFGLVVIAHPPTVQAQGRVGATASRGSSCKLTTAVARNA